MGYTKEERRKCAMRYSRLCAMLQEQDMNVICCTISMFDSVREWNRKNIYNYKEIYVKVSMDTLKRGIRKDYTAVLQRKSRKKWLVSIWILKNRGVRI